ncbi:MAG TPA: hypothetical protein VK874_13110 [Gaiellaceae bacterium]|nr:hypothetical protein [Gaiellaceae bacterium]
MRAVAGAFLVYLAASVGLFGRDVLVHPSTRVVGDDGADKTLYMWSFEWWPWTIRHGRNPLHVDVAWVPHGFDFGLGTGGGGLGLAAAPLTALIGHVATYNVLILLAPALAASTAFVLAEHLTGRFWPSLAGGYVYGFSSYELARLLGHLPLAFVALVPLVPYVVVRRYTGDLGRSRFVAALAALLVAQFLILPQIVFSLVVLGGVAAGAGAVVFGRSAVWPTLLESTVAGLAALVVLAPVLVYAVVSDAAAPARSPFFESVDLLGYVVPTGRTWLAPPGASSIAERFTASPVEQGAYLGLPLLALVALAALRRPLSRPRVLLLAMFLSAVVLSLGTRVRVAGEVLVPAPWTLVARVPVVGSALPARLTLYAALFAGLLVALALSDRRSTVRWLLVLAGVAATLPNLHLDRWSSDVPRPAFFERGGDERHLPSGSTALVLPYGPAGWSMLWQAETSFRFRMVGGHFGLRVTPSEDRWRDVYEGLGLGTVAAPRLRRFLATHDVDVVVVTPGTRGRARRMVEAAVGAPPVRTLDALVYRL